MSPLMRDCERRLDVREAVRDPATGLSSEPSWRAGLRHGQSWYLLRRSKATIAGRIFHGCSKP
jgi:hypothetical protein